MNSSVFAACPTCGRSLSGKGQGSCAYCLLQLGLERSAVLPTSGGSSANAEFSATGQRFLQQGVLPRFGDYELEEEIARGGMGVVYRARQRSLNRTVAIKMILAGQLASPESVQRFRLEAEAAARLHHPGIVPIYEIGEHETQHFFSMKLIEGVSLAACIEEFRLPKTGAAADLREQQVCLAELVAAVARALEFAHQRGVLHRDLKPSNILIDEQGEPHLTDFGLAKLTGREASGLTLSAAVLGTPGYLAPEQAAGRMDEVTTAADVYGLGAILYELLAGRPPFVAETAMETMLLAIAGNPAPSRQHNLAVHRDLETIAQRCLEKEPSRRYATAAQVADELERFIRGEPILARPVGRVELVARWCVRNPGLSSLAAALLLAIFIGSGVAFWQWGRAERARATLSENVAHLEWNAIDTMLEHGQSSRGLAKVAALVRENPNDWKAAMFAMSVLEQRRFPVPAAPQLRHPEGGELTVARLSPAGDRIATASYDSTARLWDAATGKEVLPPLQHGGSVLWAEFSPNGKLLATCASDKTVRLWDVNTGAIVGEPTTCESTPTRIAFSPNGEHLLVVAGQAISLLETTRGQRTLGPLTHEVPISAAKFVAGGTTIFTMQRGKMPRAQTWNVTTGEMISTVDLTAVIAADLSEDQKQIACVENNGSGWIASFPDLQERRQLPASELGRLLQLKFGVTGQTLAAIGHNHWTQVIDVHSGLPTTRELAHDYLVNGVALFFNDQRLLSWSDDACAYVWDVTGNRPWCEPMRHRHRVQQAEVGTVKEQEVFLTTSSHLKSRTESTKTGSAQLWRVLGGRNPSDRLLGVDLPTGHDGHGISPDGKWIALGNTSQEVRVIDAKSGELVCAPLKVQGGPWCVMFTPNGKRLIVATSQGEVSLWSLPDGKRLFDPVKIAGVIQPADISADGRIFATGSTDHLVRVWSSETGQIIHEMRHGAETNAVAFSPDGRWLASAGEDRRVKLWNTATGKLERELIGHQNEVMAVQFSPDGQRVASASLDFTARLWDATTGAEQAVLTHQGEVIDVAFHPSGDFVATASRDRTAVIWNAHTGQPYSRALIHGQAVRNLRFSPDGEQLLTLDFRGLRLWDVHTCHPLTVHLPRIMCGGTGFQTNSGRPTFFPAGTAAIIGMDAVEAREWHFSKPPAGAPTWFPAFLEAVAGQRFTAGSEHSELVPSEAFLQLEMQLRDSTDQDFYTQWARRWLTTLPQ
ncbi:protein kinase domain-containing protein [Anatilimnocola floriformis]|uniref:protein kinase domain-containing protein n=1 Tax=Anatilimnocola floriformis TaxID=2948575 RepID=UPI0020C33A07|nr:protein kinase [Anatilimnocola floriformis]